MARPNVKVQATTSYLTPKEIARAQRADEAFRKRLERERLAAQRQSERDKASSEKEARQRYLENRAAQVDEQNEDLASQMEQLRTILEHTLNIDDTISFASLRTSDYMIQKNMPQFDPPMHLSIVATSPNREDFIGNIKKPGLLGGLMPGAKDRHRQALEEAEKQYEEAHKRYEWQEADRKSQLDQARAVYEKEKQAYLDNVAEANEQISRLEGKYQAGDPETVMAYYSMVFERSVYPDDFPQEFRLAYLPDSKEIVIEYQLPEPTVIPTVAEYRYVKTRDVVEEKGRKPAEIKDLYEDMVAAICLRSVHEAIEADQNDHIHVVTFNGFVTTVDPATGQDVKRHLISVRTTKERFNAINLGRIEKKTCLRNLGAQVSSRPSEMLAVKPIVEFNMVDKRFIDQSDILSQLDDRPNLMELSPSEFENLVSNLFQKMGYETKLTRASKDGGVDAVAFDTRPIVGGKVVIQAKRYKNTVGVSAVRDLYGTMMNEGANKGILVTTRGYGPDAFDFAKGKPIELIDGGGLLYYLEQTGFKARIVFPEDG